jgi:hypothetical protein
MIVPLVVSTDNITLLPYGKKISRENVFQLLDFVQNSSDLMRYLAVDSAQLTSGTKWCMMMCLIENSWPTTPYCSPQGGGNNPDAVHCNIQDPGLLVVVAGYKNARKSETPGRKIKNPNFRWRLSSRSSPSRQNLNSEIINDLFIYNES